MKFLREAAAGGDTGGAGDLLMGPTLPPVPTPSPAPPHPVPSVPSRLPECSIDSVVTGAVLHPFFNAELQCAPLSRFCAGLATRLVNRGVGGVVTTGGGAVAERGGAGSCLTCYISWWVIQLPVVVWAWSLSWRGTEQRRPSIILRPAGWCRPHPRPAVYGAAPAPRFGAAPASVGGAGMSPDSHGLRCFRSQEEEDGMRNQDGIGRMCSCRSA